MSGTSRTLRHPLTAWWKWSPWSPWRTCSPKKPFPFHGNARIHNRLFDGGQESVTNEWLQAAGRQQVRSRVSGLFCSRTRTQNMQLESKTLKDKRHKEPFNKSVSSQVGLIVTFLTVKHRLMLTSKDPFCNCVRSGRLSLNSKEILSHVDVRTRVHLISARMGQQGYLKAGSVSHRCQSVSA